MFVQSFGLELRLVIFVRSGGDSENISSEGNGGTYPLSAVQLTHSLIIVIVVGIERLNCDGERPRTCPLPPQCSRLARAKDDSRGEVRCPVTAHAAASRRNGHSTLDSPGN